MRKGSENRVLSGASRLYFTQSNACVSAHYVHQNQWFRSLTLFSIPVPRSFRAHAGYSLVIQGHMAFHAAIGIPIHGYSIPESQGKQERGKGSHYWNAGSISWTRLAVSRRNSNLFPTASTLSPVFICVLHGPTDAVCVPIRRENDRIAPNINSSLR